MLRSAVLASAIDPNGRLHQDVADLISDAVSGSWTVVRAAKKRFEGLQKETPEHWKDPVANALFVELLQRFWHNFTLYALLPVSSGKHRILRLSFQEQVAWRYQLPVFTRGGDELLYSPSARYETLWKNWGSSFAYSPTRVRFLIPSAENCASYHFEFSAPTGLSISNAALLAGPPDEEYELPLKGDISWDSVTNPGQSAGLHAVEIRRGSLCRAQIDLRIPRRGWLTTLLTSCSIVTLVMLTVSAHVYRSGNRSGYWSIDQVTNMLLLLVTVAAGAATYVAQHPSVDIAARMVKGLRIVGTIAIMIPFCTAILLVYQRNPINLESPWLTDSIYLLVAISVVTTVAILLAAVGIRLQEDQPGQPSPWTMTAVDSQEEKPLSFKADVSFEEVAGKLGFDKRAIGVASAEGWHENFSRGRLRQAMAILTRFESAQNNPTGCACVRVNDHTAT